MTVVDRKEGRLGRAILALDRRLLGQRLRLNLLFARLLSRVARRKGEDRRVGVLHSCSGKTRKVS